jgi:KDO2-lipid IV(A) lauroyltransferase
MDWRSTSEYVAFRGARAALRALPYGGRERVLRGLARVAGPGLGLRAGVVADQLREVYPDLPPRRRDAMLRAVYDNLGRTAAEILYADPARLTAAVRVEPGWETLDAAVARGRGVIVATAHLGNFELGGRVLAGRYDLLDVVKPQRNRAIDRDLAALRRAHGIATVPMDRAGRAVLGQLRRGGVVALFIDQDAGPRGVRLDFLGKAASTWPGAARFALHTGAPVVPVATVRDGKSHVLRVGPTIDVAREPADPLVVHRLMARISRAVEDFVRDHPEQWFWVHRRWKGAAAARRADRDPQETSP